MLLVHCDVHEIVLVTASFDSLRPEGCRGVIFFVRRLQSFKKNFTRK